MAAAERGHREVLGSASYGPTPGWVKFSWSRQQPHAARAFLLEIYAAGEDGLRQRDAITTVAEDLFHRAARWAQTLDPTLRPLRPLIARAVIAASFGVWAQALRNPRPDALTDAADAITHIWLLGLTGQETATTTVTATAVPGT